MKPRYAIFALVLAGLTAPAVASAQAPVPPAATMPASPGDLPCLLRLMHLSMLAKKSADDPARDAASRGKALAMSADARGATYFYIARLGPAWSNSYRAPEAETAYKAMLALPSDQLAREMAVCMTAATDAEQKALNAMTPKKN